MVGVKEGEIKEQLVERIFVTSVRTMDGNINEFPITISLQQVFALSLYYIALAINELARHL